MINYSSSSIIFFVSAHLTAHINKMIKSSYGRNLKRPERLNDSENNLIVKCSNENCTIQGNLQVFIVQDVLHIFVTNVVILVRRLLNVLTNDLIITGFVRVPQNPLYSLSLLKKILKKGAKYFLKLLKKE